MVSAKAILRVKKRLSIKEGRGTTIIMTIEATPKANKMSRLCRRLERGTIFKEPLLPSANFASD
jgi:hypothetical protein